MISRRRLIGTLLATPLILRAPSMGRLVPIAAVTKEIRADLDLCEAILRESGAYEALSFARRDLICYGSSGIKFNGQRFVSTGPISDPAWAALNLPVA